MNHHEIYLGSWHGYIEERKVERRRREEGGKDEIKDLDG